jgi:uncharacterized protein YqeY
MSLDENRLREDLKTAMRARDELRTRVLRGVLAALKNKAIEVRGEELGEKELLAIVKREAKQCGETLEFARKAGREDSVAEHEAVLKMLEEYLPRQLDEGSLRAAVDAIVAETRATEMGAVMKELSTRHGGAYDGKLASAIVREILAG